MMLAQGAGGEARRWDRGARGTLAVVLGLMLLSATISILVLRQPSEGCVVDGAAGFSQFIHTCFGERPTPLRPGDELIAAGGISLVTEEEEFWNRQQLSFLNPGLFEQVNSFFFAPLVYALLTMVMPLSLGIAITRYRLFDINLVIRRTLAYALLTGIAALFGPLRKRVQAFIDRRFFRKKYDARLVLEQFVARAQQQAELDALSADVLATVQDALEPGGVKLWLIRGQKV